MGQKVNALSFRSAERLTISNDKWFTKITDLNYSLFIHQDILIKEILIKFLNSKNIYVNNISIKRYTNNTEIDVFLYQKKLRKKIVIKKIHKKFSKRVNYKNITHSKHQNTNINKFTHNRKNRKKQVFNKLTNAGRKMFSTVNNVNKNSNKIKLKKKIKLSLYKKYLIILLRKSLKLNKYSKINLRFNSLISIVPIQKLKRARLSNFSINKERVITKKVRTLKISKNLNKFNKIFETRLQKFKQYKDFSETIELMVVIFLFKSSFILSQYIINNLQKGEKRNQYRFLIFLKETLNVYFTYFNKAKYIHGLKIQLSGKLNSAKRARSRTFLFGNTPLQTLDINVNYNFQDFVTKDGLFGLKIWIFSKKR